MDSITESAKLKKIAGDERDLILDAATGLTTTEAETTFVGFGSFDVFHGAGWISENQAGIEGNIEGNMDNLQFFVYRVRFIAVCQHLLDPVPNIGGIEHVKHGDTGEALVQKAKKSFILLTYQRQA